MVVATETVVTTAMAVDLVVVVAVAAVATVMAKERMAVAAVA